ncbi:hypothetical protein [Roseisolibacter agri]|uniref:Uncharacterized protein n=1 Tax=Roseisolibacter agri TaxID=2014610 RepID=A0AA37Q129_9BACT|nr:hypothetical protein [Roseisolibacter agri]GLC24650.1 hypothetical protein rosag_11630 [Roseisolibacter agri]
MGVTWAVAWSAVGLVPRWVLGFTPDAPFPLIFGVFGFIAGIVFAALLALTEGRRRFEQMSLPRFAAWGAVGGLLLSAFFVWRASLGGSEVLAIHAAFAVACAVCAAGSLALARRASRRELPGGRGDAIERTLGESGTQRLRGGGD